MSPAPAAPGAAGMAATAAASKAHAAAAAVTAADAAAAGCAMVVVVVMLPAKVAVEEVEVGQPVNGTLCALEGDVESVLCLSHEEPGYGDGSIISAGRMNVCVCKVCFVGHEMSLKAQQGCLDV